VAARELGIVQGAHAASCGARSRGGRWSCAMAVHSDPRVGWGLRRARHAASLPKIIVPPDAVWAGV
jgi:hypothetical protein